MLVWSQWALKCRLDGSNLPVHRDGIAELTCLSPPSFHGITATFWITTYEHLDDVGDCVYRKGTVATTSEVRCNR